MYILAQEEPVNVTWENLIPPFHWEIYACVLDRLCQSGVEFSLGGGLALGYYTGFLRRSKDLDIYIRPEDRDVVVSAMDVCGLEDYFVHLEYDRQWIYRGYRDGVIVDAIWAMANRRTWVDEQWIRGGPLVQLCGQTFRVMPPEELIWSKLYVLQRDRCDWPDILNLLYATGAQLNWDHLFDRVEDDLPLVKGLLSVFSWVAPERAASIPRRVWLQLGLPEPGCSDCAELMPRRTDLLDSRPWLLATRFEAGQERKVC